MSRLFVDPPPGLVMTDQREMTGERRGGARLAVG